MHSRRFGRGPVRDCSGDPTKRFALSEDVKLFLATFVAGFLFVSILIG